MERPRLIDAKEVCAFPYNEVSGTDEMIQEWIYEEIPEDIASECETELQFLCWKVIEGVINVIKTSEVIDPETLPIVKDLREKLAGYENNWIDVNDELPKAHTPVIVADKQDRVCIRTCLGQKDSWSQDKNDVTDWMPLPQSPKSKKIGDSNNNVD